MSQNPTNVSVKVIGADKGSAVVFSNVGESPLPLSAGLPATVTKTATGQVLAVHGTTAGIVADIPSGK